jgi:hypothetical protein
MIGKVLHLKSFLMKNFKIKLITIHLLLCDRQEFSLAIREKTQLCICFVSFVSNKKKKPI